MFESLDEMRLQAVCQTFLKAYVVVSWTWQLLQTAGFVLKSSKNNRFQKAIAYLCNVWKQ